MVLLKQNWRPREKYTADAANAVAQKVNQHSDKIALIPETGLSPLGAELWSADGAAAARDTIGAQVVSNIPALKGIASFAAALGASDGHVRVLGYYTPGDGGGGDFRWDSTDTTTPDDLGTVLVPASGSLAAQGRWKRILDSDLNVKMFGAVGDDTADDTQAIQDAFDLASELATSSGQRVKVLIPAGVYRCTDNLIIKSNTAIENQGHLKFYGGDAVGQFVDIRAASNVEVFGGIWDSNQQGNDNTIGVGFVNPDQSVAGPPCENIFIHHLVVKNSKHGGSHIADDNDPADVGHGGGKGVTVQFGCINVVVSDVIVDNCDLGVSIEGKENDEAYSQNILFQNMVIRGGKYMGLYLCSVPNTDSLYGQVTSVSLNNIEIVDCGVGQTTEAVPRDVATLFGAITCQAMVGVKASNVRVRSTTGKLTVFRGAMRVCNWDVQVIAGGELIDVVNSAPFGGFNPDNLASRWNRVTADVTILGATFNGHFVNSDATYGALYSEFDISAIWLNNGSPAGIALARYATGFPTNSLLWVTDQNSGRRMLVNDGSAVDADSSWAKLLLNGLAIKDDSVNNLTKIGPTRTNLALADPTGATQARIDGTGLIVQNRLGFGSTTVGLHFGTGSPETVVTGAPGSVYYNLSGGAGTTVYLKQSGTGATGWVSGGEAIAAGTHAATSKSTPVDADELPLVDSAASNGLKKLTWENLKATLISYLSTVWLTCAGLISKSSATTTSAGTLTLTVSDNQVQTFSGTSSHTVKLPNTSVLAGQFWVIINNSTGSVTVQSSGANTIATVGASRFGIFTAAVDTPTTAANWRVMAPSTDGTLGSVIPMTDSNGWLSVKGSAPYRTQTATSAGTLTMSSASAQIQEFTGATTHTVKLPTTNISTGMQYTVANNSSGVVTVQSSGANTVDTVAAGTLKVFYAQKDSPTAAADWRAI